MENQYERTESFQVGPDCELDARNLRGSTDIQGWDEQQVQVVARMQRQDNADPAEIEIGQEGDRVWARTKAASGEGEWRRWLGMRHPPRVDFVIKVPRHCRVSTSMVSGTTRVQGVEGKLTLSTVSGDVSLQDVAGQISLNSVSGDITAEGLEGEVKVNTVSGDVAIQESELVSLRGNTVSGDLRLESTLDSEGRYNLSSVSGDLRLVVPADTRCTATLSTMSGDLRTALPYEALENKRTRKRYAIQGGGVAVDLSSVSGDLRIAAMETAAAPASRAPATPATPAAPSTPVVPATTVAPVTRMDILRAIESGEMTVEAGLAKLNELPFEE